MKIITIVFTLLFSACSLAQTKAKLDTFSSSEIVVKRLNCPAGTVQFARGVRWAPANNKVSLTINDKDELILPESCYAEMFCGNYRGASSVFIVDTPACGGNALPEQYLVIDLISKAKTKLTYAQYKSSVR